MSLLVVAGLTRTFAHMTQDLSDARAAVQHSMEQVDAARDNLQTILDNLTAGVVVLDQQGRLQSVNPGAARILRELAEGPERCRVGLRPEGRAPMREGVELFATDGDAGSGPHHGLSDDDTGGLSLAPE